MSNIFSKIKSNISAQQSGELAAYSTMRSRKTQRNIFLAMTILPGLLLYTIFRFIPAFIGLGISAFDWKGVTLNMKFVGFGNYERLIQDKEFLISVYNHMYLFVFNTLIVFSLAIALSVLLTSNNLRERNFYRVMFFFPTVVPAVIINILWMSVYNPNIGMLNGILELIGLTGKNWLGDGKIVKNSILFVMVWRSLGFYMVLFMAAILNIPVSLFEAAHIDGCTGIRKVFKITIPLMWEQVRTALMFFVVTSCGVGFNVVFMMTKGGPNLASEIMTTYMYRISFGGQSRFGYASAVAMAILFITTTLTLIIMKVTERESFEM
ncbi:MAG TPA: sugar ABC transporter permease [Clostridiaceae bacterium]|nr:sugar ABC transporter permease [Clostridiaceae bacterium]